MNLLCGFLPSASVLVDNQGAVEIEINCEKILSEINGEVEHRRSANGASKESIPPPPPYLHCCCHFSVHTLTICLPLLTYSHSDPSHSQRSTMNLLCSSGGEHRTLTGLRDHIDFPDA